MKRIETECMILINKGGSGRVKKKKANPKEGWKGEKMNKIK